MQFVVVQEGLSYIAGAAAWIAYGNPFAGEFEEFGGGSLLTNEDPQRFIKHASQGRKFGLTFAAHPALHEAYIGLPRLQKLQVLTGTFRLKNDHFQPAFGQKFFVFERVSIVGSRGTTGCEGDGSGWACPQLADGCEAEGQNEEDPQGIRMRVRLKFITEWFRVQAPLRSDLVGRLDRAW